VPAPQAQPAQERALGPERPLLVPPVSVVTPVGEFELLRGWLVVGRLPECTVILEDSLVSRMHARIIVQEGRVLVEDLHSTNGVYLNGVRVAGTANLREGDRILVGTTELSLFEVRDSSLMKVAPPAAGADIPSIGSAAPRSEERAKPARELQKRPLTSLKLSKGPRAKPPPNEAIKLAPPTSSNQVPTTVRAAALVMIGSLADRLFANGEVEEAAYVVSGHLRRILQGANSGLEVPPEVAELASHYALEVTRQSGQAIWMDYVVELHLSARVVMARSTLVEFKHAAANGSSYDRLLFDYYVEAMLKRVGEFSADEQARVELIVLFGERS
jgi:FHA domain